MSRTTQVSAAVLARLNTVRRLWLACGAVSVLALGVAAVLTQVDPDDVNWVVWLRGTVVAVACFVFIAVTAAVARGSRRAFTRMRWVAILAPIGIVLIIVSPDSGYPAWMKVEQGVIGALIALIAVQLNRPEVRAAFAPPRS